MNKLQDFTLLMSDIVLSFVVERNESTYVPVTDFLCSLNLTQNEFGEVSHS